MPQYAARHAGALLAASCLVLLPFGRLVEVPVLLMALLGLARLAREPRALWRDPRARLLAAVFACAWVPVAASLVDSVNPQRTAEILVNHLRFLLSGIFLLSALSAPSARRLFLAVSAWVIAFWLLDAMVQHFIGVDLFGLEAYRGRLSAMFGPDNTKFGLTAAVLAPLLWQHAHRCWPRSLYALSIALTVLVVVLAGSRAGWIVVVVTLGCWMLLVHARSRRQALSLAAMLAIGTVLAGSAGYLLSERVASRIDKAVAAFDRESRPIKNSLVHRLWIWEAGLRMVAAHPVNGVGARGFRYAFPDFARPDDPYLAMDPPQSPTHSHQLVIEIAAETGSIGLVGLIAMLALLVRHLARSSWQLRESIAPFATGLAGAYFPLNTHLAIYSAYWSQIVWFLLALYCAYSARAGAPPSPSPASSSASASRTRTSENHSS